MYLQDKNFFPGNRLLLVDCECFLFILKFLINGFISVGSRQNQDMLRSNGGIKRKFGVGQMAANIARLSKSINLAQVKQLVKLLNNIN
jgi:hypothetical protein